jgi:hypothetical protein
MKLFSRFFSKTISLRSRALRIGNRSETYVAAYVETHRRLAKEINKKHWFKKWIL